MATTRKGSPKVRVIVTDELLKAIQDDPKIVFISDLCSYFNIPYRTFCDHYPVGSEDHSKITDALELNRTKYKKEIRDRLLECKSPAGLIALYKLLATDEELIKLSNYDFNKQKAEGKSVIELKMD